MNNNGAPRSSSNQVDFDVHGLVGIRLVDPSPQDVETVIKQIGPIRKPLDREPDILVRFVDHLPITKMKHLTYDRSGCDDNGFYILRSSKKSCKARIPFESIGERCEIVCETGLKSVPLLLAILNLTMLKKDCVSVHASGFVFEETGVVVMGWAKGGKTETLLSFAAHGARYVGDEWILLSGDGNKMYGIPEIIRLWQWHLEYLPHLQSQIKGDTKTLFKTINILDSIQKKLPQSGIGKAPPAKWLRDAMPAFRRQLNVRFDPALIFGDGFGPFEAEPHKIFFAMSHDSDELIVNPMPPLQIAKHMTASIRYELFPFWEHYMAFKFAFPDLKNEFLDHAHEIQFEVLRRALEGKESYEFLHPYPVSFDRIYQKLNSFCRHQSGSHIPAGEEIPVVR